jgi:uncharacterized protein (TIRG00374 family)
MRTLLFAIVLMLAIVLVITQLAEVEAIISTLKQGDWRFIFFAFLVECAWILNYGATFQAIYRELDLQEKLKNLVIVAAAAGFINVVTPSGGMGGMAVFISEARRRGYSTGRSTVAGVLVVLFDYAAFLLVLAVGMVVLIRRNDLNITELGAAAIILIGAIIMAILLYLGIYSAKALGDALAGLARIVNKIFAPIIHRPYLSEERAREFAREAADGLHQLRKKPKQLLLPLLFGILNKALLISILYLMFLAFKVPASFGTLIAGFSIGYLFLIVSPTPSGIGVVEGALFGFPYWSA